MEEDSKFSFWFWEEGRAWKAFGKAFWKAYNGKLRLLELNSNLKQMMNLLSDLFFPNEIYFFITIWWEEITEITIKSNSSLHVINSTRK